MATEAHCAYCFETLAASLEKRSALSLAQVEELWEAYNAEGEEEGKVINGDDGMEDDGQDDDDDMHHEPPAQPFKPAAISRLLAPSPSSSSNSSIPSTATSTSDLSVASPSTSKSSSRTSIFSSFRKSNDRVLERANAAKNDEHPLFITWNTITRNSHHSLRGCIGTFEPQDLPDGLRSYSLTSAFDDNRFPPISRRELPSLEVGVTLLTNFSPIPSGDLLGWTIGVHGLRISFTYHGRRYGATYLPDVAREQGWTKEETMVSLMRKAGWNGRRDDWRKVNDLHVVTYQGHRVSMEYDVWRDWRSWVEESGRGEALAN